GLPVVFMLCDCTRGMAPRQASGAYNGTRGSRPWRICTAILPLTIAPLQWYKTLGAQQQPRFSIIIGGHLHGYFPFVHWRGWAITPGRIRPGFPPGVDLSAADGWDCLSDRGTGPF